MDYKNIKLRFVIAAVAVLAAMVFLFNIISRPSRTVIEQAHRLIDAVGNAQTPDAQSAAVGELMDFIETSYYSLIRIDTCDAAGRRTRLLIGEKWGDSPAYALIEVKPVLQRDRLVFRILAPGIWSGILHHNIK